MVLNKEIRKVSIILNHYTFRAGNWSDLGRGSWGTGGKMWTLLFVKVFCLHNYGY